MRCRTCESVMVFDRFVSEQGNTAHWSYWGWRCVFCGNIEDPIIIRNRARDSDIDVWIWPVAANAEARVRAA